MKSTIATITALTAMTMGATAFATTRTYDFSGNICHRGDSLSGAAVEYDQFGIRNVSSTDPSYPVCALPMSYLPASANVTEVDMLTYDRNSNSDVSCTIMRTDGNGNILYSVVMHSSGNAVGLQNLAAFPPAGTLIQGYWSATCTIPPVTPSGTSYLTAFRVIVNE